MRMEALLDLYEQPYDPDILSSVSMNVPANC